MTPPADTPTSRPTSTPHQVAQALGEALQAGQPFALMRHENSPLVDFYLGPVGHKEKLADLPLRGRRYRGTDLIAAIPFRQIRELGYTAHDDGTPLSYLQVHQHYQLSMEEFTNTFPARTSPIHQAAYDHDDQAYAQMVHNVVSNDIGNGEGANFVVRRTLTGHLPGWSPQQAVGLFSTLLAERGAYSTYAIDLGHRVLVGASPERHISAHAGTVMMNPISGTFRMPTGQISRRQLQHQLEEFLSDEKEILELMMVVDEELKMMAHLCPQGGQMVGPLLKQMNHLVHTEYLLQGRSQLPAVELLRESMFAATVVGSPIENACRIVAQHEGTGRGYYGAVLARIGRDDQGETLDAPIVIRTAEISPQGQVRISVGATLVRDSVPEQEVAETRAKIAGVLAAFTHQAGKQPGDAAPPWPDVHELVPPDAHLLTRRNQRLSPFWVLEAEQNTCAPSNDSQNTGVHHPCEGMSVALVSAQDNFARMLAHLLRRLGASVRLVAWNEVKEQPGFPAVAEDVLLMGPGPGDPREADNPRMATARALVRHRLDTGAPLVAVCLGHQILAGQLGLRLVRQQVVIQGAQRLINLFGQQRIGGFYNTFTALDEGNAPTDCQVSAEQQQIVALRGPGYAGVQFHPESVLTPQGVQILAELMDWVGTTAPPRHP